MPRRAVTASNFSTLCVHLEGEMSGQWMQIDETLVQMTPKQSWSYRALMSSQGSTAIATTSWESI